MEDALALAGAAGADQVMGPFALAYEVSDSQLAPLSTSASDPRLERLKKALRLYVDAKYVSGKKFASLQPHWTHSI